jgi:hypothetical protein
MPTPPPPPPPEDDPNDTLDPPMEPAQVKDMFPDDYLDPDEDA